MRQLTMNHVFAPGFLAEDPERAEALMEKVIAAFPKEYLPEASLTDVADHYVSQQFPDADPERHANLIACIKEANEIRQSLYFRKRRPG
jgi:hypothetical protein